MILSDKIASKTDSFLEDWLISKIKAVVDDGKHLNDFIDIAKLSTQFSLFSMVAIFRKKYAYFSAISVIEAICYFDNIETIIHTEEWALAKDRLRAMIALPNQIFPALGVDFKNEKGILFRDYRAHKDCKVARHLLWEYDYDRFDFQAAKSIVIERVVERGDMTDWYAILNLYGLDMVRAEVKKMAMMDDKNLNFIHLALNIPLDEILCYKNKLLGKKHWTCC